MRRAEDGEYELVLENRQVMTIFFVVVVLCGVFFGLGYIVGKNALSYTPPAPTSTAAEGKKSPLDKTAPGEKPAEAAPVQPGPELTYQKALEQKAPEARLESPPGATPPAAGAATPTTTPAPGAAGGQAQPAVAAPPSASRPAPSAGAEPIISLQVAALSRKEDAEAMVSLLQKKGFPVTLVTSPADRLLRVQVGPFASARDADEMKTRLEKEGFKVITKR